MEAGGGMSVAFSGTFSRDGQPDGEFLRDLRIHRGKDRRERVGFHVLRHLDQHIVVQAVEDARGVLGLHRRIGLDQRGDLLFLRRVALAEHLADLGLQLLQGRDLGVDAPLGRGQNILAHVLIACAGIEFGAAP